MAHVHHKFGRLRPAAARSAALADPVPLLPEIRLALTRLLESGTTTVLDLREAPLGPQDEARLFEALQRDSGRPPIRRRGSCRIRETAAPCVWIVEYLDPGGDVTAKFIEVNWCPGALERGSPDIDDSFYGRAHFGAQRPA